MEEQRVAENQVHGWAHFAALYAAEHVAATEFVIGATFVALGATTTDILIGLLIGNILAILSWTLITAPIAVDTRLTLYAYLGKIAGSSMTNLYNWANVVIFTVISAAMITVSATAVRFAMDIPAQLNWYPTNAWFVLVVICVGLVVVVVASYGFDAVADFSSICAPWLFVMFTSGAFVLLPALSLEVLGRPMLREWSDFLAIGNASIYTGTTAQGEPGIGLAEVIGFAWAANTITHFGLIDMALLRFAKKKIYGLATSTGMLFGHYVAWIAAGIMGAGAGLLVGKQIVELDPGDVAYHALGLSGYVIVIVAGWTTANANLYRAGLAAQAIFSDYTRQRTTLVVGMATVVIACFPFVFSQILPLLTYAGLLVVPVGAIVFAEHQIFPRIGFTRYWTSYRDLVRNVPAIASWGLGLGFGVLLNVMDLMTYYYIFIPTWVFTILVYTFMASRYGAKETDQEKKEREEIGQQEHQRPEISHSGANSKDRDYLTRTLQVIAIIALAVTLVFASITMFDSPTVELYEQNRDTFYWYGFICTVVYFASAYWALRKIIARRKDSIKTE